jgi:CBS domain-containing protein
MGRGGGAGRRPLVLVFQVPQAAGNGQAQHRRARRHAQGPDFGVGGHDLNQGIGAFEQILGQPQLRRGLGKVHRILLSSTNVVLIALHKYYFIVYHENSDKQYMAHNKLFKSSEEALPLMRTHAIRRLPGVDEGQAVGIMSLGDLAVERDPGSALGGISGAPPNT